MESVVFLWDFPFIHNELEKMNSYNKILINQRNMSYNKDLYDEVFLVEDITDFNEVEKIIENLFMNKYNIKSICATVETVVDIAGALREKFNITGIKKEVSLKVRNKFLMKQEAQKLGIKTANCMVLRKYEDLKSFISKNGYPIIIKPIDGAGTFNTFKINDEDNLKKILGLYENDKVDIYNGSFLLEEFSKGEEYHCDSIVNNGMVKFVSIGKYLCNCIDTIDNDSPVGSIVFPESEVRKNRVLMEIKRINEKIINGFGIDNSVCHMECFVDGDLVTFGEIATRIGAGILIGSCIENTHGVNIYEEFLNVEIEQKTSVENIVSEKYSGFITFITRAGYVRKISSKSDLDKMDGVIRVDILAKVGDFINKKNSTAQRTGYAIVQADSYYELKERLQSVNDAFVLEVSSDKRIGKGELLMSKKNTVLVVMAKGGGHYPQKLLIQYLCDSKYRIVLARNAMDNLNEFDKYADHIINVDVYNVDELITEVVSFNINNKIDAIVSVNEYAVEQTALLCKVIGVSGLNIDAAKRCRNKYLTRIALRESGIRHPKFELVREPEDLEELDKKLGFPFIVKPLNFAGSCGVTKICDESDLERIMINLRDIKKNAPSNDHFFDSMQNYWIAEEYLDGFEICVECIVNNYKCTVVAIHDKMVSIDDDSFLEQYAVTPSPRIGKELEATIVEECRKVLKAINFNMGLAHLEFRVGVDGPVLLEANARIGGILIAASVLNSTGINLTECLTQISLNQELNLKRKAPIPTCFCTVFTGKGRVKKIHGIEQAETLGGLVYMDKWVREGDYIRDIMDGYGIVLMYEGATSEEAFSRAKSSIEFIHYEME